MSDLTKSAAEISLELWRVLNSNFSAALFGALAGALSAHFIAIRSDRRRTLLNEISAVNNAIELCNSITNTFLSLKRQQIQPLAERYEAQFAEYAAVIVQAAALPKVLFKFDFIADFRALSPPLTAVSELRRTILNRVQSSTRAISVSVPLHQVIDGFTSVTAMRAAAIPKLAQLPDADKVLAYFGLRQSWGSIDETYPDLILGLVTHTDSAIYFSMLLSEVLVTHGKGLAARYGRKHPTILKLDYSTLDDAMLPDRSNFPDYEKYFRSPTDKMKTKRKKLFSWFYH